MPGSNVRAFRRDLLQDGTMLLLAMLLCGGLYSQRAKLFSKPALQTQVIETHAVPANIPAASSIQLSNAANGNSLILVCKFRLENYGSAKAVLQPYRLHLFAGDELISVDASSRADVTSLAKFAPGLPSVDDISQKQIPPGNTQQTKVFVLPVTLTAWNDRVYAFVDVTPGASTTVLQFIPKA